MRTPPNNNLWNLWNAGGPFIGDDGAPHGRVTVEPGWQLRRSTATTFDNYTHGPIRWFQLSDNSQSEMEVPNVKTIDIDRSVDVDAATCKIQILNNKMLEVGVAQGGTQGETVGENGYFWPFHGDNANENVLWGFNTNEWNDRLQPNALIRTYQGYGGRTKDIPTALADGNILLTGLWLVDEVTQDAKTGMMTIACRDMMKLLIEQMLYPPLVPAHGHGPVNQRVHYPLNYWRWVYVHHPVIPYGNTVYRTGYVEVLGTSTDSQPNSSLTSGVATSSFSGHGPGQAVDGTDPDTFWLSGGHTAANNYEYLQFNTPGTAKYNGINIQPYGGNYICYVSVKVAGVWQGSNNEPFQGIPYVAKIGIGWERAVTVDLGGPDEGYNGTQIRLTFFHLAKIGAGPAFYKCGVRDLSIGLFKNKVSNPTRIINGFGRTHNDSTTGYWMAGSDGGVFSFGDSKFYGSEGGKVLNGRITSMMTHSATGGGYRLVGEDGGVFCFGDCRFKGSIPSLINDGTIDPLGVTSNGDPIIAVDISGGDQGIGGYYVLLNNGNVYAFGTAQHHGNHTLLQNGGEPNPLYGAVGMGVTSNGYWITDSAGHVTNHGTTNFGNITTVGPALAGGGEIITAMDATSSGNGWWAVSNAGRVWNAGDAVHYGGLSGVALNGYITDIVRTNPLAGVDQGYWLCGSDGGVFSFGDADFLGSLPEQFNRTGDGNYEDYTDIVKDILLWNGWWFRNPADTTVVDVFGSLESTGIYAPENLTEDFFDKKPSIDVINTLKEIVGFVTYVDEIGAFHFHTPNVWNIGNFLETGMPVRPPQFGGDPDEVPSGATPTMALIDERLQITAYTVNVNDTDARSTITIATDDPALNLPKTKSVTITSQWGPALLRGVVRPALWVNGKFLTTEIQTTMANLIDLQLFMQQRIGSLQMPANPILQIDDQVQIYERTTSEVYIHYVRGYSTHMDLESGEYTQTLTTHWMGDGTAWFLTY